MTKHYSIETFCNEISRDNETCDRLLVDFKVKDDNLEITRIYNMDTGATLTNLSKEIMDKIYDDCDKHQAKRG